MTSETIFTVRDLAAFPRGRAVVLGSGFPPTLVKTVPWMVGPHADEIRASIAAHEGAAAASPAERSTSRNPWMDAGSGASS